MRKLKFILLAIFCLTLSLLAACKDTGTQTGDSPQPAVEKIQQLATQMPGVIDSINAIIQGEQIVSPEIKSHIAGYTAIAKDASQVVGTLASVKSPEQLAGALTAVANLARDAQLPTDSMNQVNNYLGWGSVLLKLAGVVVPLVVKLGGLALLLA